MKALHKIFITETVINFFTNGILNMLCAWLVNKGGTEVDISLVSSSIDLFLTAVCTCVLTVCFAGFSAKRYIRLGLYTEIRTLPKFMRKTIPLGILFGLFLFIVGAVLVGTIFYLMSVNFLPLGGFVLYKGIFGASVGAVSVNIVLRIFMCRQ